MLFFTSTIGKSPGAAGIYIQKGSRQREKKIMGVARPYRTRTGKGICRRGPVRPRTGGALWQQNADISVFIQLKFPVPHRQSHPSRLSNLNKTPLITSAKKFRLRMTTRHTIYNEWCDLQCDFYMEKCAPKRGGSTYNAGHRIWRRKQHWPVVSSGLSANHTKLLFLEGTCQLDMRWLRPDGPRTIRRGQGKEGKFPETMDNSNLF